MNRCCRMATASNELIYKALDLLIFCDNYPVRAEDELCERLEA